jgi:hypothetical protein
MGAKKFICFHGGVAARNDRQSDLTIIKHWRE